MKNLFDLDILRIKFEGVEVSLIKIGDGDIIYEKAPFYVPYEFKDNEFLNKVTTMVDTPHDNLSYMFYNCEKLTSVNTEDWNTCNVAIMNHMFYRCSHLVTLDVANFDTSNVTDMSYMFKDCLLLETLDVANWDTNKVADMNNMFANCDSLTSLDLSNWDVSNVTYDYLHSFTEMFNNCDALKYLNLSNWHNTNRVEMRDIFAGCSSLEVLDLRNWAFTDIYSTWEAFMGCTSLRTIRLDNCSKYVISKIVDALKDGSLIPEAIPGVTKTIYCKEENAAGLTLPYPWEFNHNID